MSILAVEKNEAEGAVAGRTSLLGVDRLISAYAVGLFALALLFGGGAAQGFWSDALVEIAALPLLVMTVARLSARRMDAFSRWALVLLALILAVPLLQLVPLPPPISDLANRGMMLIGLEASGAGQAWTPISVAPRATWLSFFALIPPVTLTTALLLSGARACKAALWVVFGFVLLNVFVDLMQSLGADLRFYSQTNIDRAVGLFANANHNAALFCAAVPFAILWLRERQKIEAPAMLGVAVAVLTIFLGLVTTHSRAGLALGFVATFVSSSLVWLLGQGRRSRRKTVLFVMAGNLLALIMVFQIGFVAFSQRFENTGLVEDLRWPVAKVTLNAAAHVLPLGTGLGSFQPVYEMYAPRELAHEAYVNHAHDDWLELFLETGAIGALLSLAFLAWYATGVMRLWRRRKHNIEFAAAAGICIFVLLLYCIFDYPLRTLSMACVFGFACATFCIGQRDRDACS